MLSAIPRLTREAHRSPDEPLNILTFPTHERYETGLCKTGHNFYAIRGQGIKDWNTNYAPLPSNYTLLDGDRLPLHVDFDLILSQNKLAHYPKAREVSSKLHLPLVHLTHILPPSEWTIARLRQMKQMRGHRNVFISEFSRDVWRWSEDEAEVIHHGVDTALFTPDPEVKKEKHALSVVNDWINRDWCCGFSVWKAVSQNLPVKVLGNTPGLSKAPDTVEELVQSYQSSQVFLNTSLVSPIPTALLEAMACGCAVVSMATCMIPNIIENGVNGYCSNDLRDVRGYLEMLLTDKDKCAELGANARKTIEERFSMDSFVGKWDKLFKETANTVYIGEPVDES